MHLTKCMFWTMQSSLLPPTLLTFPLTTIHACICNLIITPFSHMTRTFMVWFYHHHSMSNVTIEFTANVACVAWFLFIIIIISNCKVGPSIGHSIRFSMFLFIPSRVFSWKVLSFTFPKKLFQKVVLLGFRPTLFLAYLNISEFKFFNIQVLKFYYIDRLNYEFCHVII